MSGHCKGCGAYHMEDDGRLCGKCAHGGEFLTGSQSSGESKLFHLRRTCCLFHVATDGFDSWDEADLARRRWDESGNEQHERVGVITYGSKLVLRSKPSDFSFRRRPDEVYGSFTDANGNDHGIQSTKWRGGRLVIRVGEMYLTAEQAEGLALILKTYVSDGNIDAMCPKDSGDALEAAAAEGGGA